MKNQPIKLILDTDIGDDIDDAFALALILHSPELELLGVTTVFRNARQRAQAAMELIQSYGKKVPVFAGVDQPLVQVIPHLIPPEIRAKEKLDEFGKYAIPQYQEEMKKQKVGPKHALDYIIETVHKYPHEVVLVPIGPQTNIAMAIRKDPTIIPLVKKIVMMGGYDENKYPEWNIYCDPEAARIVYTSGIPIDAVGLDVTLKVTLTPEDLTTLKASQHQASSLLSKMMDRWFAHYQFKTPVLHDPLAVGTLIGPYVKFQEKRVQVQLQTPRGATLAVATMDETTSTVNVGLQVDKEGFLTMFKSRVFQVKGGARN